MSARLSKGTLILMFFLLLQLPAKGDCLLGIEGESHTSIGVYIKELGADTAIVDYNSDINLTPASILKAYTAASAMSLLDRDFNFVTNVYLSGKSAGDGVWSGDLLIKASGDPTLESEYFSKNQGFIPKIITALKNRGISRINGAIVLEMVDAGHQYPEGPIETWNINDVCWAYGSGVFDFNWCDNYFGIYPATGRTTSPVPDLKYTVWDNPWGKGLNMIRGVYSDSLIISGKNYKTDRNARINTTMPYPFDTFKAKLAERLRTNGIIMSEKKNGGTERTLLVSHKSPALDEILKSLMFRSDNMYAEGILRVLGSKYGDREESVNAENRLWDSRGLETKYVRVLDGSGLSRTNAVSARFMGNMLEWMAGSDMAARYVRLFPVSGYDGTMKSFLADTPFKGKLALKTGSVNGVQTYAGYLLGADKKPTHVVVIMINNFYCSRSDLRNALKTFLLDKLGDKI